MERAASAALEPRDDPSSAAAPIVKPQLAGPELQMSLQNMYGHLLGEVALSEE